MAHVPKNPAIPLRDGVSPSCVALPRLRQSPWPTVLDFLAERLPRVARAEWLERMEAGEVVDDNGQTLARKAEIEAWQAADRAARPWVWL